MFTPVKLGEKTRNFRYGMKAVDAIEKKFGKNISKVDFNNLTMEETATIIWAGLVHEDKEITPEKVMDLIDDTGNFTEVLEAMNIAFTSAFGSGADEKN